ncbi:rCG41169 [Rattus norvegicus]|uniref:RCG41169 n=1 Tax=Rattus norvegicus TaxID=10116 RepID=A6KIQ9_RAT|nr:rCG41169 [Rattus norvegicus]
MINAMHTAQQQSGELQPVPVHLQAFIFLFPLVPARSLRKACCYREAPQRLEALFLTQDS